MVVRLFADATGCAIFEEAPGGGNPMDPNSLMNRPFKTPMSWVANILFHSEFNYYGVVAKALSVTINHLTVAGATTPRPYSPVVILGQIVPNDYLLLTHNLGYVPLFFCAYAGQMIPHGTPIQVSGGGGRLVSAYATTTQIRLRELGLSTDTALPAISKTYSILVFRSTAKDPTLKQFDISPGAAVFGQGKFQQSQGHLREFTTGDTPFSVALAKTGAIRNGSLRVRTPDGSVLDVGPFNGSIAAPAVVKLASGV